MYSDEMIGYLSSDNSIIGYAVEIDTPSGITRAHTGVGTLLIDGNAYLGTGELGEVGTIDSAGDDKPIDLSLTLTGLPGETLITALQANMRKSDVTLYVNVFNEDGTLLASEIAFVGFITNYEVTAGSNNTIAVTVSDEFELYEMPWYEYWTDESHQDKYEGDRICRFASSMESRDIYWGSKKDASTLS